MRRETKLTHYGRSTLPGPANPPIERASTILHDNVSSLHNIRQARESDDYVLSYGRRGTTTSHALSQALCDLEKGDACFLYPTGIAALAAVISAFVKPGDHILIVEQGFHATRLYCEKHLKNLGVETSYFPWDTTDLSAFARKNTSVVLVESPTSQTFKIMDLPALCASAKGIDLTVIADNTYGSGWLYQPLALGCDISVISGTKYLSGHADTMMGGAVSKGAASAVLRDYTHLTGQVLGPDDAYACLRGMRTLALRMERHAASSTKIALWLKDQPQVTRVWHPGLPDHPGHDIWQRDATGVNGLLSLQFRAGFDPVAFIDSLELFPVGSSWGGFESLAMLASQPQGSPVSDFPQVRLHIGIEDVEDLLEDLKAALARQA